MKYQPPRVMAIFLAYFVQAGGGGGMPPGSVTGYYGKFAILSRKNVTW